MVSAAVHEILKLGPSTAEMLGLLSQVSGRSLEELEGEIRIHLAARIMFLLLGDASGAANYELIAKRIERRLEGVGELEPLTRAVARALALVDSSDARSRVGLQDLPYPVRRQLMVKQANRCAVCGWRFGADFDDQRTQGEGRPTLDHLVPFRLAGDELENLRVLCGLCNAVKEATLHVGEHGRIWTNNHVYFLRLRAVAFWSLVRDGSCRALGCATGPRESRLFVERRGHRGAWVFDNCTVRCEKHMTAGELVEY